MRNKGVESEEGELPEFLAEVYQDKEFKEQGLAKIVITALRKSWQIRHSLLF